MHVRMMRQAPDLGRPPVAVPEAFTAAFGARRDFEAFAAVAGDNSRVLGFALSRWEASRRATAVGAPLKVPTAGWRLLELNLA